MEDPPVAPDLFLADLDPLDIHPDTFPWPNAKNPSAWWLRGLLGR